MLELYLQSGKKLQFTGFVSIYKYIRNTKELTRKMKDELIDSAIRLLDSTPSHKEEINYYKNLFLSLRENKLEYA
jgi:hypothetical protein